MNILFFTRLYYPHVGGVEKHVGEISLRVRDRGNQITILTERYSENLKKEEIKDGIRIKRINYPKIKFIGLVYIWWWLFKNISLIKESDIVHIHDVFIWYYPFKILFPQKKVYVTFHGWGGKYPVPLVDKLQKKIGSKFANGVICIGKYILKYYGIKSDIVTYGAVEKLKSKKRYEKIKNYSVYVGRLDKDTGLPIFLEFLKGNNELIRSNKIKIDFFGDGELRRECEKYGRVYGWVNKTYFYRKARFVFVSGYLSILEALANNCLVIAAYKNSLQKDYYNLTPFRKFIFCSDSPQKIYEKFMYYQNYPEKTKKIIREGCKWAKNQTWEKMTNLYLKLWRL